MLVRLTILGTVLLALMGASAASAADPPEWAISECRGLKALSDVVNYWIDRQNPDGSFGFGLDDDCEFYTGWTILVYAADDQRVLESLHRNLDWVWYNDEVQDGYQAGPGDPEHSSEVTSYTTPLLTNADYGNPLLVERLMATSKNLERWTAINRAGHRHFRGNWLGSQEMRDYSYFATDATMIGRAALPMMHYLYYNHDPDFAEIYLQWCRAWVAHAKETKLNKPYGLLPGEVVFDSDEIGGLTKTWYDSASSGFAMHLSSWYMARIHETLIIAYLISGDPEFLLPARETLKFYATATPENIPPGIMWPAWYTERVSPPTYNRKPEQMPLVWQDYRSRISPWLPKWYRMATGDGQFDRWWGGPPGNPNRQAALSAGQSAVQEAKAALETAKTINIHNSIDNYRANISTGGFPSLYHGGNNWVDWPRPACRWRYSNYELAVVLLGHGPTHFKALCCNVGQQTRNFGLQLFELESGTYRLTVGLDTNADDQPEKLLRDETITVERGTELSLQLDRGPEYLVELRQLAKSKPWTSRADVAVCSRDIFAVPSAPQAGTAATLKVRVHNIGTEDAPLVTVWAEEVPTGTFIGEQTITLLARPRNMIPCSVMVEMPWNVSREAKGVRVRVDGGNLIEEIYEGNNEALANLADLAANPPRKRKIYVPLWYEQQQKGPVPTYTAAYVENIKIDGKPDDPDWRKCERRGPLNDLAGAKNEKQTFVRIGYGADALYLAIEAPEPDMDLLVQTAFKRDTYAVFCDDGVEMFFDTNFDKQSYLQFAFNVNNIQAEGQYFNFSIFNEPWESAIFKGKDFWTACTGRCAHPWHNH